MSELVSVIIPNYNCSNDLRKCLDSVLNQTHPQLEVIIIDNKSSDDSVDIIKNGYPHVTLIENTYNAGWGIACNIGIENAKGNYYLMLNNDAWMAPDCTEQMLKAINKEKDYGACASKILLGSEGKLIEVVGLQIFKDGFSIGRGRLQTADRYDQEDEVFCANDCCCLFKKEMFDDIGLYDEDFFIYADETDIGWKAQLCGWKCIYSPQAIAYHGHSKAAGSYSNFKAFHAERNRIYITFKYFPLSLIVLGYGYSFLRYLTQLYFSFQNKGALSKYMENNSVFTGFFILMKAHILAYSKLSKMLKKRRKIMTRKRISRCEFYALFDRFGVSVKQISQYE